MTAIILKSTGWAQFYNMRWYGRMPCGNFKADKVNRLSLVINKNDAELKVLFNFFI